VELEELGERVPVFPLESGVNHGGDRCEVVVLSLVEDGGEPELLERGDGMGREVRCDVPDGCAVRVGCEVVVEELSKGFVIESVGEEGEVLLVALFSERIGQRCP